MKLLYTITLLLLTLQACNNKNELLLCEENYAIDLLSLTDSTGLSLKATYNKGGGAWDSITGYHYIVKVNGGLGYGWFVPEDYVFKEPIKQKYRVYKNNEPFSGMAKVCVPLKSTSGDGDILVLETMNFENGYLDGKYMAYQFDKERFSALSRNRKFEGNFRQGYLHGLWQSFDYDGNSVAEGNYKMGKKDGYWNDYIGQGEYISGKKEGDWHEKEYGGDFFSGRYLNDEKNGLWIRKDSEGNILERITYKNGNEINCEGDCD